MKTAQDIAAIDRWIEEYALPHLMKTVRQQIRKLPLKRGDEVVLTFHDDGPELYVPPFVVEHFMDNDGCK